MEASSATVFVIDDDPSVRRGLARLMHSAGWRTEVFESATAFLQRPAHDAVGCIVLDLCMPDMSGLELQQALEERDIGLPIVFLTGRGDIAAGVTAMKHGAVDFLTKPVDGEALLPVVAQALIGHAHWLARRHDADHIGARMARLSLREREVMEQVLTGRLNKQIAGELGIAEKTVKVHRGRVMAKMEVGSVAELVHLCDTVGVNAPALRPT